MWGKKHRNKLFGFFLCCKPSRLPSVSLLALLPRPENEERAAGSHENGLFLVFFTFRFISTQRVKVSTVLFFDAHFRPTMALLRTDRQLYMKHIGRDVAENIFGTQKKTRLCFIGLHFIDTQQSVCGDGRRPRPSSTATLDCASAVF